MAEASDYWKDLSFAYIKYRLKQESTIDVIFNGSANSLPGPFEPEPNSVTEYLCDKAYYTCEKLYETLLESAVNEIDIDSQTDFPHFMKVCDELLFTGEKIECDYVVCLFCLAGLLAVQVYEEQELVKKVCDWLATYLDARLSNFIENTCGGMQGCLNWALLEEEGGNADEDWPTPYGYDKDSYEC